MKAVWRGGAGVRIWPPNNATRASDPKWERTPSWMFWKPYWRMLVRHEPNWFDTTRRIWIYRTKRQLAREFLAKQFNYDGRAETEGGHHGNL